MTELGFPLSEVADAVGLQQNFKGAERQSQFGAGEWLWEGGRVLVESIVSTRTCFTYFRNYHGESPRFPDFFFLILKTTKIVSPIPHATSASRHTFLPAPQSVQKQPVPARDSWVCFPPDTGSMKPSPARREGRIYVAHTCAGTILSTST